MVGCATPSDMLSVPLSLSWAFFPLHGKLRARNTVSQHAAGHASLIVVLRPTKSCLLRMPSDQHTPPPPPEHTPRPTPAARFGCATLTAPTPLHATTPPAHTPHFTVALGRHGLQRAVRVFMVLTERRRCVGTTAPTHNNDMRGWRGGRVAMMCGGSDGGPPGAITDGAAAGPYFWTRSSHK